LPREVFAEEIETFLERLDTVAAARVVSNEAGEIERIYATTESRRDDGSIRRAITSALMSQYNLHVDGWRVHIAHLEPEVEPEPIPECHLLRLEETITESATRVVVELGYEREGTQKTLTGSAQAPPGQAFRARTVALATLDALRTLVDRARGRASLEGLMSIPFAGATIVVAAVSLASERGSLLRVGSETVAGSEAEATVGAILDAIRKPLRGLAGPPGPRRDRRRQFDGLRQRYEQMIRGGGRALPVDELPPPESPRHEPPQHEPPAPESPEVAGGEQGAMTGHGLIADDTIQSLGEIRPEREGGAAVMMREEMRSDVSSARSAPRPSVEDNFYRRLVATAAPVHIRCRDGYEIPAAVVKEYGTYSLLVEVNGVPELVFKHAIIAIRPYGPVPSEPTVPPS
jgi:sRNA-binding regulator protein Hfq